MARAATCFLDQRLSFAGEVLCGLEQLTHRRLTDGRAAGVRHDLLPLQTPRLTPNGLDTRHDARQISFNVPRCQAGAVPLRAKPSRSRQRSAIADLVDREAPDLVLASAPVRGPTIDPVEALCALVADEEPQAGLLEALSRQAGQCVL